MLMQLPFDLDDVRMICVDGDQVRFVLPEGHVEVVIDSRKSQPATFQGRRTSSSQAKHTFFDDGIFGI